MAGDPHNILALTNKATSLYESGAIEYYDKALAMQPNHVGALTNNLSRKPY